MHHLYFQFGIDRYEIVIPKMDRTSLFCREKKENARVISELNKESRIERISMMLFYWTISIYPILGRLKDDVRIHKDQSRHRVLITLSFECQGLVYLSSIYFYD
jgi:hypothetical protein